MDHDINDDETEPDLLSILNHHDHDDEEKTEIASPEFQHHHLSSISATVVVRQLPSQGLSFQLWPAASSLVSLLDNNSNNCLSLPSPSQRPLRILELGSGIGLLGISAAAILGAAVTLTDLPHVLPNLLFNAGSNAPVLAARGGALRVRQLSWGDAGDIAALLAVEPQFDVVVASDVVYYDYLFDPLLQTLLQLVRGEVVFVMAHLRRWNKRDALFFRKAKKMFDVSVVHTDAPLPGCRIGVAVYRFVAKP